MKIKNQEKIMRAVKTLLDAENAQAALLSAPKTKRSNKAIAERNALLTDAQVNITQARQDLRAAHTEIIHEEYDA